MKAIGIDLGTTNSVVTRYNDVRGTASVLANAESETLTPSVVGMRERDGSQKLLVGRNAVNFAARNPTDTVVSVKRLMGRDYAHETVAQARDRLTYEIVPGADDDPRAHVVIAGKHYTPAEVSSIILDKLRRDAARALGEEVTHAVITVPAYFLDAQRAATREAGTQAGLTVKKIIDEPTAAAVAFGLELNDQERRRVLVYDLGGGTFDISILHMAKDKDGRGHFQVLSFTGDSWLGGDDFDHAIVNRIIEWVKADSGVDPTGDKKFLFVARSKAEEAKRQLSQLDDADIVIPAAYRMPEGGGLGDVDMVITRDEYEAMIQPLVERTMRLVQQALADQNLSPEDISDVLLVGGSTLTPKVYETVESYFGAGKVRRDVNPMECVALGAGILAGTMNGVECPSCARANEEDAEVCEGCHQSLTGARTLDAPKIYEVTGMALGIGAVRGAQQDAFVPIIPRGTPYPLPEPMKRSFNTTDGRRIRVPVYEGDSTVASKNTEQGVVEYELPQEIDVNTRVDVSFNYDSDRIVTVRISVPGTHMIKEMTLRTDTPRTLQPAAQEYAEENIEWRQQLTATAAETHRFLETHGEFIDPAQTLTIRRHLEQAERALHFSDDTECQRMANVLRKDLYGSGVASQFLLAERATAGAPPETARQLNNAVADVRRSYQAGNSELVGEQTRLLRTLIAQAFTERDVAEVDDAVDFDGLLRIDE
ncbi:Hsp70 family protein [Streptomyces beijiangensis]|uniref:Hsp70 family protein n=1 Tax=Streptomyces beijiangensis TaxID=163361 RepID=A0A939F6I1_9ACTN|nr:Hsp70 family protein [Streptomyces beijiangensis]MBO0512962.1 Hsp70 family protein [Streptomyces beijiangensis]